ncbi:MAG: hypothetical protein M1819_001457 [Sarea resinae]|nr:MAG: hypothetical protein M1819_001457 [Sarea resinae]
MFFFSSCRETIYSTDADAEDENKDLEFDEDDCREFLQFQLGTEITRYFRYAEGVQEVKQRFVTRYGDTNTPKAMSIFYDVLRGENNASGLGDEGDIWRTWRHDFKLQGIPSPIPVASTPSTQSNTAELLCRVPEPEESFEERPRPRPNTYHPDNAPTSLDIIRERPVITLRSGITGASEGAWCSADTFTGEGGGIEQNETAVKGNLDSPIGGKSPQQRLRRELSHYAAGLRSKLSRKVSTLLRRDTRNKSKPPGPPVSREYRGRRHSVAGLGPFATLAVDSSTSSSNRSWTDHLVPDEHLRGAPRSMTASDLHYLSFSLDGAADDVDYSLKKPLTDRDHTSPLLVDNIDSVTTVYSGVPVGDRSTGSSGAPSTRSTVLSSTDRSSSSTKHAFKSLTRDILSSKTATQELQRSQSLDILLDPTKFSPQPSHGDHLEMGDDYARYFGLENSNPFATERNVQWTMIPEEEPSWEPQASHQGQQRATNGTVNPQQVLFKSASEGGLAFSVPPKPTNASYYKTSGRLTGNSYPTMVPDDNYLADRGRSMNRVSHEKSKDMPPQATSESATNLVKRSRSPMKKMFGEKGLLGRSVSAKDLQSDQNKKTGFKAWGGKIKERVGEFTGDLVNLVMSDGPKPSPVISKFPVSLDPITQCSVYGELELMICVTANTYLMTQRREDRISVESVVKITDYWRSKGRPQVIEFQFDQATQCELISINSKHFRFYGEVGRDRLQLSSMLYHWKALAREMSVRTFCYPDSMVRKHLIDIQTVLEGMGAPLATFLAFQDIRTRCLKIMKEEGKKREEKAAIQYGVSKRWSPKLVSSPASGSPIRSGALLPKHPLFDPPDF